MSDSSRASERYTHGHHESVLRSHSWRTVENSAAYLQPHLTPGLQILDVGCGPGTITVDLARRVAPAVVIGLDASEEIVAQARELATAEKLTNVWFMQGDAYRLEAEDDSFDIVHAHQVLQHVADPIAVLREMRRVVKPGGIVAVRECDYHGTTWYPMLPQLDEWMRVYQHVARANGGEPDAGRRLKSWALKAGFGEVTSSSSIWNYSADADRAWWGQMWADRATKSSFGPQAIETGATTQEGLDEIAGAWREWAASDAGYFAMPHGEIIARK